MVTIKDSLQAASAYLRSRGIADADVDAWYLLEHVIAMNRAEYILHRDEPMSEELNDRFQKLIELRASHIPLQHITGVQEFMGLEFEVNKNVLIPRQDTELLVEETLKICSNRTVLDLCTGSGCIIISLVKLGNPLKAAAVDISAEALDTAKRNAQKHGVAIEFWKSDLYEKVEGAFDIIVSNPPYISRDIILSLMPEVREHEPYIALEGGVEGLDFYYRIIRGARRHLSEEGMILLEIGHDQGESVRRIFTEEGYKDIKVLKDLSGLDRVVSARP